MAINKLLHVLLVLQGDFLLIILKNLLEKQRAGGKSSLKVILMYVDISDGSSIYVQFYTIFWWTFSISTLHKDGWFLILCRSATVDSHMFSKYFGYCPVVTAEGRTHPVSTQFLEDIHEKLSYRLASDSPSSINYGISSTKKVTIFITWVEAKKSVLPLQVCPFVRNFP